MIASPLFLFVLGNTSEIDKMWGLFFPMVSGLCLNIYFGLRRWMGIRQLFEGGRGEKTV